jgi:spore coat protein U-like protein
MRRWMRWLLTMPLVLVAPFAAAQTCTVSYVPLNFGNYVGTLQTGVNHATVNCTTAYTIGLNAGLGAGATTATRKMTGPAGATLNYQLFQNAARTTNWGNTSGVDTFAGTGSLSPQTINIYSQVAAGQLIAPGTYNDTISSATASFTVTAVVQATCLVSATNMAFGTYTGAVATSTSAVSVTCTNTTPYNIGLSAGLATGATVTTRKMTGPASATLNYALFRDSARTLNWGNTVGTDTISSTGNGSAQLSSVFGKLAVGQLVTPGAYSDTIIVTVTY